MRVYDTRNTVVENKNEIKTYYIIQQLMDVDDSSLIAFYSFLFASFNWTKSIKFNTFCCCCCCCIVTHELRVYMRWNPVSSLDNLNKLQNQTDFLCSTAIFFPTNYTRIRVVVKIIFFFCLLSSIWVHCARAHKTVKQNENIEKPKCYDLNFVLF